MILKVPYYQLQVVNVNMPPVKVLVYNKKVKFDEKNLNEMANHLIGKKLSVYRENVYDADGDGKVTLKDFIHRIKNLAGAESSVRIKTTPTTPGGGY